MSTITATLAALRPLRLSGLLGAVAVATLAGAPVGAATPKLTVEHVVVIMRHGVRPPTKDPAMPPGIAAEAWPSWTTRPGWLTQHGAEAVQKIGKSDRATCAAEGLLPSAGCPSVGAIALVSDSDQRTIATGDAWAAGLAPGCTLENRHRPQDDSDPLFSAIGRNDGFDAIAAEKAVRKDLGAGGVAALEVRERVALDAVERILCGDKTHDCGVKSKPSMLASPSAGKKPGLEGALDLASTVSQILLLEYAEGKPSGEVGWGRATASDVELLGSLHSTEFEITARTPYVAQRSFRPLIVQLRAALSDGAPPVTVFVGHDTTVASLGGLLGLHWKIPGFARDDPAPGGALILESVHDDGGHRFVRAIYRSQTLDEIRNLSDEPPVRQALMFGACDPGPVVLCPVAAFDRATAALP